MDFQNKLAGALVIMTREALALFMDMGPTCIRGEPSDRDASSLLKDCLDSLGIDHQSDYQLLHDRRAGLQFGSCADGWIAAFSNMRTTHEWSTCFNKAMCGSEGACD